MTEVAAREGNGARFEATPLWGGGTSISDWVGWDPHLPELDLSACPGLVLVAPHPDDETLGLGGCAATLTANGVDVQVVSVSDGGAAHPHLSPSDRIGLECVRRTELYTAAEILGVKDLTCLGLPDGRLGDHESQLAELLTGILESKPPGTWCAPTWRGDGHPDHEAVGRAASTAVARTAAVLVEYPVWMWHWSAPDDAAVPWHRARRVPLAEAAVERKTLAAQSFRSQLEPSTSAPEPLLPPFVLARLLALGEVVFQ